ncbi:hypothetical protein N665_0245s0011 [Sinapis alba]|nr:hypothetical protein N665_0245s0011 [Sinapis alba]
MIIFILNPVRVAEWSKAPDSSSGLRERAWVQIPLLTFYLTFLGLPNDNLVSLETLGPIY